MPPWLIWAVLASHEIHEINDLKPTWTSPSPSPLMIIPIRHSFTPGRKSLPIGLLPQGPKEKTTIFRATIPHAID